MWSEYLRMIDFSFHDDSSSSSPSRRCRMTSVPRLGLSIARRCSRPRRRDSQRTPSSAASAGAAGLDGDLVGDDEAE